MFARVRRERGGAGRRGSEAEQAGEPIVGGLFLESAGGLYWESAGGFHWESAPWKQEATAQCILKGAFPCLS